MYSSSSKENYAHAANEMANDTKNALKNAGDKASDALNKANDKISQAKTTTVQHVRDNPVQSTLIALGVGYVLGKFFRR